MANVTLINELQAIQNGGQAAWLGLSSVSPQCRFALRKAEQVNFPSIPHKGIENNIVALCAYAISVLLV